MALVNFSNFDDGRFHILCNDLVIAEYPAAKCNEGTGGDRGIDCYLGVLTSEHLTVFQHKYLPRTLGKNGKRQIEESLNTALRFFNNVKQWILLIPKDFTIGETEWFNKLKISHPTIELDVWDETKLRALLRKLSKIRYDYFPLTEAEQKIKNNHESKIIQTLSDWSNSTLWYDRPFPNRCLGMRGKNGIKIETFPFYKWTNDHLHTGYGSIWESYNNMQMAISAYNILVDKLEKLIDGRVKEQFKKEYAILDAAVSEVLTRGTYQNAFYSDEINTLVFNSIRESSKGNIPYLNKQMLKLEEITQQSSKYFVLSSTAPLLCTSDRSVANEDKFLNIIKDISFDSQLISEFQTMHQSQLEMERNVSAFKNSLNSIIDEMEISSTIKGSCSACPHNT